MSFWRIAALKERLGRVLLHLAATRGVPSETQKNHTVLPISHDDLAQMAAMSRPHVTVTMGKLRRQGFVQYTRNNPLTVDVEALSGYLTGEAAA